MIHQLVDIMHSMLERIATFEWLSEHFVELLALFGSFSVAILYYCRDFAFDLIGVRFLGPRYFRNAVQHHCRLRGCNDDNQYAQFVSERADVAVDHARTLISVVDRDGVKSVLESPSHYREVIIDERFHLNEEIFAVAERLPRGDAEANAAIYRSGHELFAFLVYDDLAVTLSKSWSKTLRSKAHRWQEARVSILRQIVARFPEPTSETTTASETPAPNSEAAESNRRHPPTQIINALNIGYLEHFQGRQTLLMSILADVSNPRNTLISVIGRGGIGKSLLAEKAFDMIRRDSSLNLSHIICFDANVSVESIYRGLRDLLSGSDKSRFTRAYKKAVSTTDFGNILKAFGEISFSHGLSVLLYFDEFEVLLAPEYSRRKNLNVQVKPDSAKIVAMISGCIASHPPNVTVMLSSRTHVDAFRGEVPPVHASYSLDEPLTADEIRNFLLSLDRGNKFDFRQYDIVEFETFSRRIGGTPRCVRNTYSALNKDPLLSFATIVSGDQFPGEIGEDVVDRHLADVLSPAEQNIRLVISCLQEVFRTPVPVEIVSDAAGCTSDEFATCVRQMSDSSLVSVKPSSIGSAQIQTCSMHPLDRRFGLNNISRLVGKTEEEFCRSVFHQAAQSVNNLVVRLKLAENDLASIHLRRTQFNLLWQGGYRDLATESLNRTNEVMFAAGLYDQVVESNLNIFNCEDASSCKRIHACNNIIKSLNWSGKLSDAMRYSERAIKMCESVSDPNVHSSSLALRADCYNEFGKSQLALRDSQMAHGLAQKVSNLPAMAFALFHSGRAHRGLGDIQDSIRCFQECLALEEVIDDTENGHRTRDLGWVKRNLAQSFLQNGESGRAKKLLLESEKLHRDDNNKGDLSLTLVRIARLNLAEGNLEFIVGLCEEALELSNETTLLQTLVEARQTLVLAYLASGHSGAIVFAILDDLEDYSYPRFDQFTAMLRAIACCLDGQGGLSQDLFLSSIDHCDALLRNTPGYVYAVSCRTICQACLMMTGSYDVSEFWESLRSVSESNLGIGIRRFVLATLRLMETHDRFGILPDIQHRLIDSAGETNQE